ncbi:MAG: glycosyltransferase [Rhizobiales bacterium]|nr:glycosyltransferase [Hyphomicrobiales bacterium]
MDLSPGETMPKPIVASNRELASSRDLDRSAMRAVVVVPTFRRPEMLAATLASLRQQTSPLGFAVVIVENDAAGGAGAAVARAVLDAGELAGLCVVEAAQGNVHAINAGFATALDAFPAAEYFLMIDDDEVASPGWLDAMITAAERENVDVVGGPVVPRFADGAPSLMVRHPVFWPAYETSGPVEMIYGSGNCLMRRRVFERLGRPAFDPRFNFLGGGDMDFFTRCRRAGFRSYWTAEAVITETVPAERAKVGWIVKRGLRIGAINRAVDRKNAPGARGLARILAKDLAILPLSLARAVGVLVKTGNPLVAAHPLAVAAGRIGGIFGQEPQPYRAAGTPSS